MDRLQNKLRLVRSQSMGVGVGQGGGQGDTKVVSRPDQRTGSDGRATQIVLLDDRRLELVVQPRLYAGELLDLVASQCGLREKEYFGLAVVDDAGHYTWLQLDRKVLDHDLPRKPQTLTVHFLVKFFIESISHLAENQTVELFYLQARSLIWRGLLEVEADIVFQLASLGLQAGSGDFVDELTTRSLLKKTTLLPTYVLKEQPSHTYCEDQVIEHYKKTAGQTRGQALVNYMTIVESMPTYGVHYFEVYDKRSSPWWLGLSCKGIAQYKHSDRKVPVRVFQWKQLENLYFRDKKFSIEVHDAKRVVQTLSSFNLYEDALKLDDVDGKDGLADAIADSTTQVSVSRRTFNPGSIHVYVWYAATSGLTKCIWQSAISQHQFYLDRKQARMRGGAQHRTLKEIARDLTRSSASLSSASSTSNVSLSGSAHSLAQGSLNSGEQETELTEEARRARQEMVVALKARREALEEKLKEKKALLKELCLKEGELTGELPPEIPLAPGEPLPVIRRRVGTEFQISESFFTKAGNNENEGEQLAQLELELEIQSKITCAALKLANDSSARKNVRRARKISYNQSQKKLKELEFKVASLKHTTVGNKKKAFKQPRDLKGGKEELRRGISVPDLENGLSDQAMLDSSLPSAVSPRSCPSSPRKQPLGLPHTSGSGHSPARPVVAGKPRGNTGSGYIPSSVYLRSSYRAKQYPTLSTGGRHTHRVSQYEPGHHPPQSATLPSPYRNKFELNAGCDSPVGLYNCPQQRTSQAFSSLDDLDGLAGLTGPPTRREPGHTHYPSLERSARKKSRPGAPGSLAHPLATQSTSAIVRPDSRSLEQLEVLENAGARGAARHRGAARGHPDMAAREQALDDLVYRTQATTLRNTEEYPRVVPRSGYDEVDGSYPALPLPARRTTLLPGQTYPEPSHPNPTDTLLSPPDHPTLFSPHRHHPSHHQPSLPRHGQTLTVHARKVETTFGLNDSVHTATVPDAPLSSPSLPVRHPETEEPLPPLFPKQYYLKQRTPVHSSYSAHSDSNTESPAVPRKLKPPHCLTSPPSSLPLNESNSSFETAPVSSDSGLGSSHHPAAFVPYRETSKPFEMSDFYKYSTKFRKTSASSLKSDSDCPPAGSADSDSPRSGSASQRSSTSRESVPPELPAKPSPASGTVTAVPAIARLKPLSANNHSGSKESLADAFSTEMLAWYEQKSTVKGGSGGPGNKPATLV